MKQSIIISIIGILIAAGTTNAQDMTTVKKFEVKESKVDMVRQNCAMGLRSDNEGLISASLIFIGRMKLFNQTINTTDLRMVIDSLSVAHPSESIRYKAYLTSTLCNDPQWFLMDPSIPAADDEQFFPALSHRLYNKLFGMN